MTTLNPAAAQYASESCAETFLDTLFHASENVCHNGRLMTCLNVSLARRVVDTFPHVTSLRSLSNPLRVNFSTAR